MDMPRPSAGHRRLELLAGTWKGAETMFSSQWDPEGGTAVGRSENRMALGGFVLIHDYEQKRDGATTFTGHGIFTFDPKKELFSLHWFDSMGSPPEIFTGGFTGDVLTLSHGAPPFHVRLTWDMTKPGQMGAKMEMSKDGATWKKLFEAEYRRG